MYFAYGIASLVRNYVYAGLCKNVEVRFNQHQQGRNRTTRAYRPFELIYVQSFEIRKDARKKELYLKSGVGKEFLRAIRDQKNKILKYRIGNRSRPKTRQYPGDKYLKLHCQLVNLYHAWPIEDLFYTFSIILFFHLCTFTSCRGVHPNVRRHPTVL